MNIEEIQNRFERGYTMAIYGTRENIHEQMTNDIEKLLKAINFTGSSLELKEKEVMSFEEVKHLEHKHNVLNKLVDTEDRSVMLQFFENGEWVDVPL